MSLRTIPGFTPSVDAYARAVAGMDLLVTRLTGLGLEPSQADIDLYTAMIALDLLLSLETTDWSRSTDCAAWTVAQMAAHNLGMAEMAGSLPETGRQLAGAGRRPEQGIDALTAHQVDQRATLRPPQLIDRYRAASSRRSAAAAVVPA